MIHFPLHAFTNLGDSAITGSFTLGLAAYLLFFKQKGAAAVLVGSYALTALCIALGKVTIYTRCQPTEVLLDLQSPSGHSALSLVAYGLFGAFISSSLKGWPRHILFAGTLSGVVLIAASRVLLGHHTLADVCVGLLVGGVVSASLMRLILRGKKVDCPWIPFIIMGLAIVALLHGQRLPAEDLLEDLSNAIRRHFPPC